MAVHLRFNRAPSREVDLVVGADGLHSRIRQIAFGPQADFEVSLGYHVAAFELHGYRPRDELVYVSYGVPGKTGLTVCDARRQDAVSLHVSRRVPLPHASLDGVRAKNGITEVFANSAGNVRRYSPRWRMSTTCTSTVSVRFEWTNGHAAAQCWSGDAAACVSLLAGEGTGLAMAEAYVLAAALGACGDQPAGAFARYQASLMPLLRRKQDSAARFASAFVPRTAFGITYRNVVTRLLRIPPVADFFIGRDLRDDFALPDLGSSI